MGGRQQRYDVGIDVHRFQHAVYEVHTGLT